MIDIAGQKRKAEELKRKILETRRSLIIQDRDEKSNRPGDAGNTVGEKGDNRQANRTEDAMWEGRGGGSDADQRASEAAQRRLEALENELREEEERRKLEKARLRAEELKKRSQEEGKSNHDQGEGVAQIVKDAHPEPELMPAADPLRIYLEVLRLAFQSGRPDKNEEDILALLRQRLGLTEKQHDKLVREIQLEKYSQAMSDAWRDGVVTQQDSEKLDNLREQLGISAEDHLRLDRQVRRQTIQRQAAGA